MNEVFIEQLRELNRRTLRVHEEPTNPLYAFREYQAIQDLEKQIVLYGAVGYPLD